MLLNPRPWPRFEQVSGLRQLLAALRRRDAVRLRQSPQQALHSWKVLRTVQSVVCCLTSTCFGLLKFQVQILGEYECYLLQLEVLLAKDSLGFGGLLSSPLIAAGIRRSPWLQPLAPFIPPPAFC